MRNAISIKLQSNIIEITLRPGCSPVNLLHIFRTTFPKNTYERLLLNFARFFITTFLKNSSGYLYIVLLSLHEKRSFSLIIFLVNVTKSAISCGFGHIY